MVRIRGARAAEAEALSALVMRSKAHWGYDPAFLAACAGELRIRAEDTEARRITVAEAPDGAVLGVASLEGGPAEAVLGLLFVAPEALGRGVGRALYREVLRRARELGIERLVIDADPHAVGFYRAMGAVCEKDPGPGVPVADTSGGLVRFSVELPRPADWVAAWTGGRPAVHVGNVAEFNAQFRDSSLDPVQSAAHHYACLAAFYSPLPAALVLPRPAPPGWLELLARRLDWPAVELYDGVAVPGAGADPGTGAGAAGGGPEVSAAVLARPALAGRLHALGLPLVPWGQTEAFGRLSGRPLPAGALRHESKAASHRLFCDLAGTGRHPQIAVPAQWYARTRGAAARLLARRARAGLTTVLKSEHGVGGSGTLVVTARQVRESGGARAMLRRLPRGPQLVEEYVEHAEDAEDAASRTDGAAGTVRDLTYDGFVDGEGRVWEAGAAVMEVAGTGYAGATVGPGVVPPAVEGPLLRFGRAVGAELAAAGYRGWFDVDFVADGAGLLAPTETNLRLTGPSIAFMAAARLDEVRGGRHLVRIMDRVELGARLPDAQLTGFLRDLDRGCAELGAVFLPAIPTAAFEPAPFLGVLVAAHTAAALDAAAELVREEARLLGAMFEAE
ncbi:GNAT family N-acetyltransferase [Streptomyces venezuelae]|uniref:GNAT family N-acetyltransferase n=1 Tax=Streptomyces venezuelae TaxID=54571 RepID=UPI001CC262F1|nr:GNAT family N-acetyltransferase [Streptomyces venezuelae]